MDIVGREVVVAHLSSVSILLIWNWGESWVWGGKKGKEGWWEAAACWWQGCHLFLFFFQTFKFLIFQIFLENKGIMTILLYVLQVKLRGN